MSTWNRDGYFDTRKRFEGPLDLRAPEDQFATEDQVEERYRQPVQSLDVEHAINSLMRAWQTGDATGARLAAEEVKGRTRAYFNIQGVPVFAHPILPPQLAHRVREIVQELPLHVRETELNNLANQFGPDLRTAVAQEFARGLSLAVTRAHVESRDGGHAAQNSLSQIPRLTDAFDLRHVNPGETQSGRSQIELILGRPAGFGDRKKSRRGHQRVKWPINACEIQRCSKHWSMTRIKSPLR